MGGHKAGDFASRKTVEIMVEEIEGNSKESPVVVLRESIEKANDAIELAKEINGVTTYKYTKTAHLFKALMFFYMEK